MRRLVSLAGIAALAALAACSGSSDSPPPPVDVGAGGYTVHVEAEPARITLVAPDGHTVWATRGGDEAGSGSGAPLGFAAVGSLAATVEMSFGSFKFTEDAGAETWRAVDALGDLAPGTDGASATFTLLAAGSAVGSGALAVGSGGHLEIQLSAPDWQRVSLAAPSPTDEHLVGLGGQSYDVDHRGYTVPLWVQEDGIGKDGTPDDQYTGVWFLTGRRHSTHTPMPMLLSSYGYALAVDTNARAIFALASEGADAARYESWSPALDLHVFAGDPAAPRAQLQPMIDWVGRAPKPKPIVFAPWVDAIFGSANVRRVAQHLRSAGVAASVIWTEDWRGGASAGGSDYALKENWRVDRSLYPDIEAVADDLHADGFSFLTYFNTFLDATADVYPEAIAGGYELHTSGGGEYDFTGVGFGSSTMLDFTDGSASAWASGVLGEGQALGADGWMADFAEWEPTDAKLASGEDALAVHNRYPVDWAAMNRQLLGDQPFFMRAAWLHSQPLASVIWPGDQQTDWSAGDGLPSVIPMGIGLGVTGFPVFGGDIGGYMSQGTTPTTEELWYRWVTFGALQPVMRTHHGRSAYANFQWEHDAASIAHFARWTRFHQQLAAYQWGTLGAYETTGLPLMRLVALEFPAEPWAWTATDEYLLGDRILVAPVQTQGATGRDLVLPAGTWYPLLGGDAVTGGAVHADAPATEIPAFVPAGTLLVLYPASLDTVNDAPGDGSAVTLAQVGDDREVWLYPGTATDPARAQWNDDGGPTGTPQWTWSGGPAAATSATFNGSPVTLTAGASFVTADLVGDGTLSLDTGGSLVISRGSPTARTRVKLFTTP